jgi:hypothetical protein
MSPIETRRLMHCPLTTTAIRYTYIEVRYMHLEFEEPVAEQTLKMSENVFLVRVEFDLG